MSDYLTISIYGTTVSMVTTLAEVNRERVAQDARWGEQNHADGTGAPWRTDHANKVRRLCQERFANGEGTWLHILQEEVAEAGAESDEAKLRAELIQVAAVAVAWVEAIDRRTAECETTECEPECAPHLMAHCSLECEEKAKDPSVFEETA